MREPRGQELIERYKKNYNIPASFEVTELMVLKHWELEKSLTKELLESSSEKRWEVFELCYSKLYSELKWLNLPADSNNRLPSFELYKNWLYLIGSPPKKIYEIGSGQGELISSLASYGFKCKATEITRERGQKCVSGHPNLSWGISDGVHLERFESPNSYDAVISNQVIEHLHPDDLFDHFKGVLSILSAGGGYIFATPHLYVGPSDISRVFKYEKPMGMHLKEYTYQELKKLLEQAGFENVCAILVVPQRISHLLKLNFRPIASRTYFYYLCKIEQFITLLPRHGL